jgi:hypothetical protein
MLLFGRLPWAPGVSKKFFLFGNLLAISSFIPHTQNNKSKKFFPTFPLFVKNLKKITLNPLSSLTNENLTKPLF